MEMAPAKPAAETDSSGRSVTSKLVATSGSPLATDTATEVVQHDKTPEFAVVTRAVAEKLPAVVTKHVAHAEVLAIAGSREAASPVSFEVCRTR